MLTKPIPPTFSTASIQANMIAYMRLFADLPGVQVEDGSTFWIVSGKEAPGDMILKADWQAAETDAQIDAVFTALSRQTSTIDWMVFPCDQPADLSQRLAARGMPGGRGGNWLWADLTSLPDCPAVPAGFHVEQVRSDSQLAEWVRLSEAGFEEELSIFYDAYARHGYGPEAASLHYIGYLDDTPVTSGTLLDAGGSGTIYDLSTPPGYRHRGLGGALTQALMSEIRARGYTDTWIWSSNIARSLYQSLGYSDADFGIREHSWKRTSRIHSRTPGAEE